LPPSLVPLADVTVHMPVMQAALPAEYGKPAFEPSSIAALSLSLLAETVVPDDLPRCTQGHAMVAAPHTPGAHNPRGYETGFGCDLCGAKSASSDAAFSAGRIHCVVEGCNCDFCPGCTGRA
jgi:hypothetical protein